MESVLEDNTPIGIAWGGEEQFEERTAGPGDAVGGSPKQVRVAVKRAWASS